MHRLLPKDEDQDSQTPSTGLHSASLGKTRPSVPIACGNCRKRKVRCDGHRPECLQCAKKNLECTWRTLERPGQITKRLRQLSRGDALSLFEEIRTNSRKASSLDTGGSVSSISQDAKFVRSCLPSTSNSLEFELAVRHPIAYPTLFPISAASLETQGALQCRRFREISPALDSEIDFQGHGRSLNEQVELAPTPEINESLCNINISKWTSISLSNILAARILSLYFRIDYPNLPLFNKDLFLDDMTSQRPCFCSRLLVSALMGWACQAYAAVDTDLGSFSAKFFLEAESILSAERHLHTLTTVSALILLSMTATTHGRDATSRWYMQQSVKIGQLMGLFNAQSSTASATQWLEGHADWTKAASYTAWGVFNLVALHGLHNHTVEITVPPRLPKPGIEYASVQEHSSQAATGDPDTDVFASSCDLWLLFHKVLLKSYGDESEGSTYRLSITFAEEVYRHLLDWAKCLPLGLVRHFDNSHSVMMMHMYFHSIIMDLFRPFLRNRTESSSLRSFETMNASPRAVCNASTNQLKRLVLLYRTTFPEATLSVLWQTGLISLANAVMLDSERVTPEWNYYMRLSLAAVQDLSVSYQVFDTVTKGLVGMALQRRAISAGEVKHVRNILEVVKMLHTATERIGAGELKANWIIDSELALSDPVAAQGSSLADHFQRLAVADADNT